MRDNRIRIINVLCSVLHSFQIATPVYFRIAIGNAIRIWGYNLQEDGQGWVFFTSRGLLLSSHFFLRCYQEYMSWLIYSSLITCDKLWNYDTINFILTSPNDLPSFSKVEMLKLKKPLYEKSVEWCIVTEIIR